MDSDNKTVTARQDSLLSMTKIKKFNLLHTKSISLHEDHHIYPNTAREFPSNSSYGKRRSPYNCTKSYTHSPHIFSWKLETVKGRSCCMQQDVTSG